MARKQQNSTRAWLSPHHWLLKCILSQCVALCVCKCVAIARSDIATTIDTMLKPDYHAKTSQCANKSANQGGDFSALFMAAEAVESESPQI